MQIHSVGPLPHAASRHAQRRAVLAVQVRRFGQRHALNVIQNKRGVSSATAATAATVAAAVSIAAAVFNVVKAIKIKFKKKKNVKKLLKKKKIIHYYFKISL